MFKAGSQTAETILRGRAKKSGQDKQALGVTVPSFIMHLQAIVFILELLKN